MFKLDMSNMFSYVFRDAESKSEVEIESPKPLLFKYHFIIRKS